MRTTRLAKKKKSLFCSGLNLMPWILRGKPLIFLLSAAIQTAHVSNKKCSENFQENQRDNSPTTCHYLLSGDCHHLITGLMRGSDDMCTQKLLQLSRSRWHLHNLCYPHQCRITKQGKLIYRAAQRMAGTNQEQQTPLDEEVSAKETLCCLLPPFPQSCHSHYLSYSPASSFKTTHTDFIKETKRMGTLCSFCLPRSTSQMHHAISHGKRPLVWHCREIHWPPHAPELQPTNPNEASRWVQTSQSDACTW